MMVLIAYMGDESTLIADMGDGSHHNIFENGWNCWCDNGAPFNCDITQSEGQLTRVQFSGGANLIYSTDQFNLNTGQYIDVDLDLTLNPGNAADIYFNVSFLITGCVSYFDVDADLLLTAGSNIFTFPIGGVVADYTDCFVSFKSVGDPADFAISFNKLVLV